MKRRLTGGLLARRGFLTAALAGGLGVVTARRWRGRVGDTRPRPPGGQPGGARVAEPWAPLREEVVSPLGPSGSDLAG